MQIYIASDHGGFELKNVFVKYLKSLRHIVEDFGPKHLEMSDDYPTYAVPAIHAVQKDTDSLGILICRNGVGVSILANKFKNIRCALSWAEGHIKTAREDDNVNILAIPADYVDGKTAKSILDTYLRTNFSGAERHVRRLAAIQKVEND